MGITIALNLVRRGAEVWWHKCPACEREHPLPDKGWELSGTRDKPTFTPSFRQIAVHEGKDCHYNITDGQIVWHADSWHGRKGSEPMVYYDTHTGS